MKKKNILFTGGTGFIGKNVLPILRENYNVFAPKRNELNLFSSNEVKKYVMENNINYIIHSANPNPSKNIYDSNEQMLRDSLQLFLSIYSCREIVKKIIYLGSGAIYDKTKDIIQVEEESAFDFIPKDDYGFAKYVMNYLTFGNVYNLCVFGCYGPYDAESKFITHCINCCINKMPITIHQNCIFDYLHVFDLGKIMNWMLANETKYNTYNACSGQRISLLDIAKEVKKQMSSNSEIVVLSDGWNYEYTGSNKRLIGEYNDTFIDIKKGISLQIEWELSKKN